MISPAGIYSTFHFTSLMLVALFAFLILSFLNISSDVERQEETHDCKFTCHYSTCYDVITLPDDPHTFLTCGEDDCVRWFDLRIKTKCSTRECQEVNPRFSMWDSTTSCFHNYNPSYIPHFLYSLLHNFCQDNTSKTLLILHYSLLSSSLTFSQL